MHATGRKCTDVVFTDAHRVKRTVHFYTEKPLHVCGREIVAFPRYTKMNHGVEGGDEESGADTDTAPWATRNGQGGSIFVSNIPPETTQEELSEALELLGKYERLVMRMSLVLHSQVARLSELTI